MSENCDHPPQEEQPVMVQEASQPQATSPIITPADGERWPLLEVASQPCNLPINDTDAAMIGKMDALLDALDEAAVGIAAVQIGYPKRIFLLRETKHDVLTNTDKSVNRAFVNPVIVSQSQGMKRDGEACLSLPGFGAVFKRPKSVTLQYFDIESDTIKIETFNGFWARAICHEMDHLNGTLIAHHLEQQMLVHRSRTKFGMQLTPHRRKVIADRRAQRKRAKSSRRANRG